MSMTLKSVGDGSDVKASAVPLIEAAAKASDQRKLTKVQSRLVRLKLRINAALDCFLEAKNNVERREWDFAETNLRTLFRNASLLSRLRKPSLRALQQAKRNAPR
ncbi:MAG: hypothetical protein EBS05_12900 [Proteobacteria bacterium]|nr:hypothetical protein [Pseudomonadota bacterium]